MNPIDRPNTHVKELEATESLKSHKDSEVLKAMEAHMMTKKEDKDNLDVSVPSPAPSTMDQSKLNGLNGAESTAHKSISFALYTNRSESPEASKQTKDPLKTVNTEKMETQKTEQEKLSLEEKKRNRYEMLVGMLLVFILSGFSMYLVNVWTHGNHQNQKIMETDRVIRPSDADREVNPVIYFPKPVDNSMSNIKRPGQVQSDEQKSPVLEK